METTNEFYTILVILALLGVYAIIAIMMKWIAGDYSPISITEENSEEIAIRNFNGDVIGKKLLVIYKHTYRNNNTKYKSKYFKL